VNDITFDPDAAETDRGVYRSTDGGERFEAMTGNLPNDNVRALAIHDGRVYVGLYGGSVWGAAVE
jgi:hypothetical protein